MSQRSELKPCPFCGGKVEIKQDTRYPRSGKYKDEAVKAYEVICPNYDCIIYNADNKYFLTEEEAAKAWNSRVSGWISVNERLPEKRNKQYSFEVLITNGKDVFLAYYDYYYKLWWNGICEIEDVSHWMPLPEFPERR